MTITSFDDLCLYVYVLVDDAWQVIGPQFRRSGPQPSSCSDSELLTMALVGECCGWEVETELIARWRQQRHLFPHQPSRTRFNRRRRALKQAFDLLRLWLLEGLNLSQARYCVIDSLPLPVVAFHHAPRCNRQWRADGAAFGRVSAKQATIYGYKLHLLSTLDGLILDWVLAPANERDLPIAEEILPRYPGRVVLGDKAYLAAAVATWLRQTFGIVLLTLPRRNQRQQLPDAWRKPFNDARRMIETVNSQLTEQFRIERNHALSLAGLTARVATKITAHVCSVFLNCLLGNPDWLHLQALVTFN